MPSEGWGSFTQKIIGGEQTCSLEAKAGKLQLGALGLAVQTPPRGVTVSVAGRTVNATHLFENGGLAIALAEPVAISAG